MDFKTCKCPKCNADVAYQPHMEGKLISCQDCGHVFTASASSRIAEPIRQVKRNELERQPKRIKATMFGCVAALSLGIGLTCGMVLSGGSGGSHAALWVSNCHNTNSRNVRSNRAEYEQALKNGGYIGFTSDLCEELTGEAYGLSFENIVLREIGKHGWKLIQVDDQTNFYFVR